MSAMGGRMDGLRVLDLFAGSGALGLETLSRGAEHVVFVERARGSLHFLRHAGGETFDVALADPPYAGGDAERLVQVFRSVPFARELWVEHPWREALPLGPQDRTRRYGDTALSLIVADP